MEQALLDGCRMGSRNAQKELYERLSGKMLGLCRRYIADNLEAEGVMVNGFLKVFDKINQFTGQGSFEGWVRRIMVNESLYYLRKNKTMYLEVDLDQIKSSGESELVSQDLLVDDLLTMVNNLPMGYRTVFNLFAIEGYSHKEIAKILEITPGTSKSQLSRARLILQKQIVQYDRIKENKSLEHGKA